MRRFVTADLEWPPEISKKLITFSEVKLMLVDLKLEFSADAINDTLMVLNQYSLDVYNEINYPGKKEQRNDLENLILTLSEFREKIHAFIAVDPDPSSSEMFSAINKQLRIVDELLGLRLKRLTVKGQGKGGGPREKRALMMLIQRLLKIYKRETREIFVEQGRSEWGREKSEYNRSAIHYLSLLISLVDRNQATDLRKIVNSVIKKKYRPGIDLS